jgi:hypothetical protein
MEFRARRDTLSRWGSRRGIATPTFGLSSASACRRTCKTSFLSSAIVDIFQSLHAPKTDSGHDWKLFLRGPQELLVPEKDFPTTA